MSDVTSAVANRSVLVVDDETGVRDLMSRWLQAGGYAVTSAAGADEALGACQTLSPAVALCDIRMPGRDGIWLAEQLREQHPETAVIMATGIADVESAISTVREGVFDYLTKPFGRERVHDAVVRGIEWHRSALDSRCWRERLEADVRDREARLIEAIAAMTVDSEPAVDALLSGLTVAQPDEFAHARRVAELSVRVAAMLGMPEEGRAVLRRAAMLHDLGKLAMPEALLRKPAPLSVDETALIRQQTRLGAGLIAGVPYLERAAAIVAEVAERPDGLGYPEGRQDPSLEARIVAAVNAYDTMMRPCGYRRPLAPADALTELSRCSGTQFDAEVVRVLKQAVATH